MSGKIMIYFILTQLQECSLCNYTYKYFIGNVES